MFLFFILFLFWFGGYIDIIGGLLEFLFIDENIYMCRDAKVDC